MKKVILISTNTYDVIVESINSDTMRKVEDAIKNKKFNDDDLKNSVENLYNTELPCKVDNILSIGATNSLLESQLSKYIPSKDNQCKNYYCYAKHDFSSNQVIIHDSATSAFYCALELLGKPRFAVIYKRETVIMPIDQDQYNAILEIGENIEKSKENAKD